MIFSAKGNSIENCFRGVIRAFSDLLTHESLIDCALKTEIELKAKTYEELVFDFVEHLVILTTTEPYFIPTELANFSIDDQHGKLTLRCFLVGDYFDPKKHQYGTEIKAASYHQLKVTNEQGSWAINFLVDI